MFRLHFVDPQQEIDLYTYATGLPCKQVLFSKMPYLNAVHVCLVTLFALSAELSYANLSTESQ